MEIYAQEITVTLTVHQSICLELALESALSVHSKSHDVEKSPPTSCIGVQKEMLRQIRQTLLGSNAESQTMVRFRMVKTDSNAA